MRRRNLLFNRTGLLILACALFLLVRMESDMIISDLINKINSLSGYVSSRKEEGITTRGIINQYMPVVGYVDSHYIETDYLTDPSYDYETRIEYIDLDETSNIQEENTEEEYIKNANMEEENEKKANSDSHEANTLAIQSPVKFQRSELNDFDSLINRFYTVTSITELKEDKFDVSAALDQDMTIQGDNSSPQILIFHTHSQEAFADSVEGDNSTSIVAVGARLAEILSSQYGYNVIHDTSVYDYVDGVLDRSKAYTYAEQGIQNILEQYPTVEVVLDIHRDGVSEDVRLVTDINGKPTARMMFFNGISYTKVNGDIEYLKNPYIQDNLAMSLQMYLLGKTYYPDMLRKIYINGYRYCLHFRAKSMLIEVGAQNNTLEEELNAMEPLADMLNRLFTGEKAYE
ncbi:MAG: stage II sporulation protein P [Thermoflexaceae bacterium]|nr:stage II sporulation protein P [Thermoflexaceae bacterium]